MKSITDVRSPAVDIRELPSFSRLVKVCLPLGFIAAVVLAFTVVQTTFEAAGLTEVGQAQAIVIILGSLVAVPLVAFISFVISCFEGALIALFDRRFSFRRLYLLTTAALSFSLLTSSVGASALLLWSASPVAVVFVVTILNCAAASIHSRLLCRLAGACTSGSIAVLAVWALYTITLGSLGVLRG